MIRIRIDDVMCDSSQYSKGRDKAIARFEQMHRWFTQAPNKILHVPTIIVKDIQEYPETICLLKREVKQMRMFPQIHGYEHLDYNKLTEEEIKNHLELCIEWFQDVLEFHPTIWITPWGSESEMLSRVARSLFLQVEGVRHCITPGVAVKVAKEKGIDALNGRTVMEHWWKKGLNLLRLSDIARLGSYEAAVKWDKETRLGKKESIF